MRPRLNHAASPLLRLPRFRAMRGTGVGTHERRPIPLCDSSGEDPSLSGVWLDGVWDKPMGWWHLDQIAALIHRPRPDGRIDLGYAYMLLAATR